MFYINWFVSTSSSSEWKDFFQFWIRFRTIGRKICKRDVNIDKISMYYYFYQLIRFDKLYKLMESFLSNFRVIFESTNFFK